MIRLTDVRRSFRVGPTAIEVLRGVDLLLERGERLAVTGASGSGKSTLLHILALLDAPSSGSYRFEEREVTRLDDEELSRLRNRRIGMVFQAFHLLPGSSALDNVALRLLYRGLDWRPAAEKARQALRRVGLGERAETRVADLSGGQQQRVAIARALVGEPALLLADEPTGALDRDAAAEVLDLLVELNEREGLTTVLVTHDPAIAARCPRRLELRQGVLAGGAEAAR